MREQFTERARRVIVLAAEEARRRNHRFVATEHLLLGLIRDGEGMAVYALQRLGLDLETLKAEVERALVGLAESTGPGDLAFSPELKRVLELSIEAARDLDHPRIGTEDFLLGLMNAGESNAARILYTLGMRLAEVRREVAVLTGAQVPFSESNLRLIRNSRWRINP